MLQLTEAAADHLADAARARGLPDSVAVRVYGEPRREGGLALAVTFADLPAEGDQIAQQGGTRLFIGSEVADLLSEVLLDLRQTVDGPRLVVAPAGPGDPSLA